MTETEWLPPDEWLASLPKNIAAAGALVTDAAQRMLIVKPNYRDHWQGVGGVVDEGETPQAACRREMAEEIGIDREPGRLLLVDWTPPVSYRPIPLVEFIFDGGNVEPEQIRLEEAELDEYRFAPVEEALSLLSVHGRRQISAALRARRTGGLEYSCGG